MDVSNQPSHQPHHLHPPHLLLLLQIYSGGQLHNFIDGYDVQRSNWMRYVNPGRCLAEQNLVACQNGRDIFFYTIRPVEPKQELLVWYSQEFAQRLCGQQDHSSKYSDENQEPASVQTWLRERTKEEVKEEEEEKIDVELLERDTPPDTPDDHIMDFSKKVEKEEREGTVRSSLREPSLDLNPAYVQDQQHLQAPPRNLPLHLHGLYSPREGLVSSYPLYPPSRPLQPAYQFLPPYGPHYPRLLLPSYSPPFPGMLPSRGPLRYGGYLGSDGLPYPPVGAPNLLPVSLPFSPSNQGGLKELTANVSPPPVTDRATSHCRTR